MRTIIAESKQFTMPNLLNWATTHLIDSEGGKAGQYDPARIEQLITAAVSYVLPEGFQWDQESGLVYVTGSTAPPVKLNLEAIAYVVIGAVVSDPWARPRTVPADVPGAVNADGSPRVVFGWSAFEDGES